MRDITSAMLMDTPETCGFDRRVHALRGIALVHRHVGRGPE